MEKSRYVMKRFWILSMLLLFVGGGVMGCDSAAPMIPDEETAAPPPEAGPSRDQGTAVTPPIAE
jgi:hypothetical protein